MEKNNIHKMLRKIEKDYNLEDGELDRYACEEVSKGMTLRKFLTISSHCVDVYLAGYDYTTASVECGEPGKDLFTEEGYNKFKKFLDAEVVDIRKDIVIIRLINDEYHDAYINGYEPFIEEDFGGFLLSLAGYCSSDKYDLWFN